MHNIHTTPTIRAHHYMSAQHYPCTSDISAPHEKRAARYTPALDTYAKRAPALQARGFVCACARCVAEQDLDPQAMAVRGTPGPRRASRRPYSGGNALFFRSVLFSVSRTFFFFLCAALRAVGKTLRRDGGSPTNPQTQPETLRKMPQRP